MAASQSPANQVSLTGLPEHLLVVILRHCDRRSLLSLSRTNKHFHSLIQDDYVWLDKSRAAIATNQQSTAFAEKSSRLLTCLDKCKVSLNWQKGRCQKKRLVSQGVSRYLPWVELEKKSLWFSQGDKIFEHRRQSNGFINGKPVNCFKLQNNEDVRKFIVKKNLLVSAGLNGTVYLWNKTSKIRLLKFEAHTSVINGVELLQEKILVTGSKDRTVKFWALETSGNSTVNSVECKNIVNFGDRILSISANEWNQQVLIGTAGCTSQSPLKIYNTECNKLVKELGEDFHYGAGVLQTIYESPHQILSCGYDTFIRLWDTRMDKEVLNFEDPFDSAIFSISSDFNITILSGTNHHSLVRLWDKRFKKTSIQMYYTCPRNSPVYSLAFDPCFAYIGLDNSITMLSFLK